MINQIDLFVITPRVTIMRVFILIVICASLAISEKCVHSTPKSPVPFCDAFKHSAFFAGHKTGWLLSRLIANQIKEICPVKITQGDENRFGMIPNKINEYCDSSVPWTIVLFVREPLAILESAYRYHRAGNELNKQRSAPERTRALAAELREKIANNATQADFMRTLDIYLDEVEYMSRANVDIANALYSAGMCCERVFVASMSCWQSSFDDTIHALLTHVGADLDDPRTARFLNLTRIDNPVHVDTAHVTFKSTANEIDMNSVLLQIPVLRAKMHHAQRRFSAAFDKYTHVCRTN